MQGDFVPWLLGELDQRGWPQAEFARRARLSPATVSRVLSGENNPGEEFIQGTARALDVPVEAVMRRAGKLPRYGDVPDELWSWAARLMTFTEEERPLVISMMESALRFAEEQRRKFAPR